MKKMVLVDFKVFCSIVHLLCMQLVDPIVNQIAL
jgi:hypothetical protein